MLSAECACDAHTCCCALTAVAAAAAAAAIANAQAAAQGAGPFNIDRSHTGTAAGGSTAASQCARDCFAKAEELGYQKVVGDSMACFLPVKATHMYLSSADCCDKVRHQHCAELVQWVCSDLGALHMVGSSVLWWP